MPINLLADESQAPINLLAGGNTEPEMVDTFLGRLPKYSPEFQSGTPQNKALVEDMVGAASGGPGFKMIGSLLGKGAGNLKNLITSSTRNTIPHEAAAAKAAQDYEAATEAAKVPKPGLYRNPMSDLQDIEHKLGSHINAEAEHGVRAAQGINSRVKAIEDYWSDAYKQFEEKIKDSKFVMPERALNNLDYDMGTIMERLKQGADPKKVISILDKEKANAKNPFYEQLIAKAPTAKDTSAADFMAKYRDFRDTMGGLKSDLRNENILSSQKEKIRDAIKQGKDVETQIKEALHQGLGEHKPEFDRIMKGYSEQVYPLRGNPLVEAAKQGKMPDNIIKALRTNESGMDVLRGIVKQDPELLRNVVGQRYMAKPGSIHAPNELTREFLDEMPEFKNLLAKREDILREASRNKNISLKNKIETENKLRELQDARAKARKKLWIGAGTAAAAVGVPYGYGKLAKLLTGE